MKNFGFCATETGTAIETTNKKARILIIIQWF